jgi:hypothetical protein
MSEGGIRMDGDTPKTFKNCCPSMEWNEESGCYVMQKETNDYINDHLEQLRQQATKRKLQRSLLKPLQRRSPMT